MAGRVGESMLLVLQHVTHAPLRLITIPQSHMYFMIRVIKYITLDVSPTIKEPGDQEQGNIKVDIKPYIHAYTHTHTYTHKHNHTHTYKD